LHSVIEEKLLSEENKEKTSNFHIFDPKHIDILESKERKIWQNPEKIF
jgi:hypothetical protein